MSRLQEAFLRVRANRRAAFIPYLTAGFPDEERFLRYANTLLEVADVLEVGLPFSDPLGDGPTIQRSSELALAQGVNSAKTMELIAALRQRSDKPIVCMTYYNPIYCHQGGEQGFLGALKAAGADGVILPDLPADEAQSLISNARALGMDTIFLIAPTSTDKRLSLVTGACTGFIYAVSVTGVTGEQGGALEEVKDLVGRTRRVSQLPVAVGFGIATPEAARGVAEVADGVVVGSALIKAAEDGTIETVARELARACASAAPQTG